jgi:hypothetical protein
LPNGLAAAVEQSENETKAGLNTKTRALGLGYAVSKDVTVGYQIAKTDLSTVATPTEKIQGINIGYNLGPVAITGLFVKADDVGAATAKSGKAAHVGASVKF